MTADTTRRVLCPGTDKRTGAFAGDEDVCPVCESWVRVNREARLRRHWVRAARLDSTRKGNAS